MTAKTRAAVSSAMTTNFPDNSTAAITPALSRSVFQDMIDSAFYSLTDTTLSVGIAGTGTGAVALLGTTSGTVTIQPQGAAGTYNFNLPTTAGTAGQVLTSQGGGSTAMTWATVAAGAPLTTKGDLFTYDTGNQRLAVGTNGQVLTADSAQATGIKWATVSGTGNVTGAASSTTNALAGFTDTGGITLQDTKVVSNPSTGATTITSAAAQAFAVGPNGATTPLFSVDASTASAIVGVKITGTATSVTQAVVGATNASLAITTAGSGNLNLGTGNTSGSVVLNMGGSARLTVANLAATMVGDFKLGTAGNGLYVKEGSNATMGVATLVGGAVTVSTTKVTANSRIWVSVQSLGTVTVATDVAITARTAGTSFVISSSNIADTSVVAWWIVEPA